MQVKYDGKFQLATALSAKSLKWTNRNMMWSEFVAKLAMPTRTRETVAEFHKATRDERSKIKDNGGYVTGYLRGGRRKPGNLQFKQVLTLDIDFGDAEFWSLFTMQYECAAVLHSTHSHTKEKPKYRLLIPLDREVAPDQYTAIARRVAGNLNVEMFDTTTFQPIRLMFWPSCPKDGEYVFEFQDGPHLNVDEVLASYIDWRDSSLWPTAERQYDEAKVLKDKQEDPDSKKGLVGAFCRAYGIAAAIEEFLPDEYTSAGEERYTYTKGSTACGLIVYDDKFAFSHHGTDPASGKLCNAFDLVRLHKFGHMDEDSRAAGANTKSFHMMQDLAAADPLVREAIAQDRLASARYDFADIEDEDNDAADDTEWLKLLDVDKKGDYLNTSANMATVLSQDPRLKGKFAYNSFDGREYVMGSLPWRRVREPEVVRNVDLSGLRNYFETLYGLTGSMKLADVLALEMERNSFDPVLDYLNAQRWDKVDRVDTLLVDYLGCEDNAYTRAVARKFMVGAVARAFDPGCKFEIVLTLVGSEGTGKSTLPKMLGGPWFTDSFHTVTGKEAFEQLQGAWIVEVAELAAMKKAEVEIIKHFMSKQDDAYRPAYGRAVEVHKRRCVFVATTNKFEFLSGEAGGNRRFVPVDVNPEAAKARPWELDPETVGQLWAEAVELYKAGEPLYFGKEVEAMAKAEQRAHQHADERVGIIQDYLDVLLPADWEQRGLQERRLYLEDPADEGKAREAVCIYEIWCEVLGRSREDFDKYKTRELHDLMAQLPGWERVKGTRSFGLYGTQKYYRRVKP